MEDLEALELSKESKFIELLAIEIMHHSGIRPSLLDLCELYMRYDNIDDAVNEYMIAVHEYSREQHFNWNW